MLELMTGTVLVLVLLVAVTASFSSRLSSSETERRFAASVSRAESAVERLVRTPGETNDQTEWETQDDLTNVTQIGLAQAPYMLSEQKLGKFKAFSEGPQYERLKALMGLAEYEFFLNVYAKNADGVALLVYANQGSSCTNDVFSNMGNEQVVGQNYSSVVVQRAAVLDSGCVNLNGAVAVENYFPVIVELTVFDRQLVVRR